MILRPANSPRFFPIIDRFRQRVFHPPPSSYLGARAIFHIPACILNAPKLKQSYWRRLHPPRLCLFRLDFRLIFGESRGARALGSRRTRGRKGVRCSQRRRAGGIHGRYQLSRGLKRGRGEHLGPEASRNLPLWFRSIVRAPVAVCANRLRFPQAVAHRHTSACATPAAAPYGVAARSICV